MLAQLKHRRTLSYGANLLVVIVVFAHRTIVREIASFLIVEDSLHPAANIVALGGQTPFREMGAALLYRTGWAPKVMIVPGAGREETKVLKELGIKMPEPWALSREVLIQQGVRASAIVISKDEAEGTREELKAAYQALQSKDSPVILVTSKYHTRRTRLTSIRHRRALASPRSDWRPVRSIALVA
jgi:uncharacterized SAM-binding protein YcdF (DUF218 family)